MLLLPGPVSVTDFRSLTVAPEGNRFLSYSLFPESIVNVKIRRDDQRPGWLRLSVGHSIFKRECRVNVGVMLARFEGGGHPGAGGCSFHSSKADAYIPAILDILVRNQSVKDNADTAPAGGSCDATGHRGGTDGGSM